MSSLFRSMWTPSWFTFDFLVYALFILDIETLVLYPHTVFTRSFEIPGCDTFFPRGWTFEERKTFPLHTILVLESGFKNQTSWISLSSHKRIHQNPELAKRWMDVCDGNVTTAHGSAQHCLQWHSAITHAQNFFHNQAEAPIPRCTIFYGEAPLDFSSILFFSFPLFCASFELWGAATSSSTFHLNFACTAVLFIFFSFLFCQTNFHTQRTSFIREEISILASKFSFTAHFDCTPRAPHTITRANCEREQLNTETLHTQGSD